MLSPEEFEKLFGTNYTEVYRPPLNLPKSLADEFNKVMLAGDADAAVKYYCEVILPYCYSADLERKKIEEWRRERAVKNGRLSVDVRRKTAHDNYLEWQEMADMQWKRNPDLSRTDIAKNIVKDQKEQKTYDHTVKVYAVDTIRRIIKKK
jgi:hypothetical protein